MTKKIVIFILLLLPHPFTSTAFATKEKEHAVSAVIEQLFAARANLLITQNTNDLSAFYSQKVKNSKFALQMEKRRADYLHAWAKERGIQLIQAKNKIIRSRIQLNGDTAKVSVVNSLRIDYNYSKKALPPHSFGIGTRHSITLKNINNEWLVWNDWYSDPMEEDPNEIPALITAINDTTNTQFESQPSLPIKKYNRMKAVTYADKYAGCAWGAGNNNRYNFQYKDYHYEGGDCTNFASQVLADPLEGGGLKMTTNWRANPKGGTTAWVQANAFKQFLIYSGYGRAIATGSYQQLTSPTARYPKGAISQLKPGDLIGYILENNDIDHFSIVVGKDTNDYLLVNSHTGDRYHVPWDIGWNKYTRFIFIHIND